MLYTTIFDSLVLPSPHNSLCTAASAWLHWLCLKVCGVTLLRQSAPIVRYDAMMHSMMHAVFAMQSQHKRRSYRACQIHV